MMTIKNKKHQTNVIDAGAAIQHVGVAAMIGAMVVGLVQDHLSGRIVIPNQPAFALAGINEKTDNGNTLRREREETGPHYISYSVAQRTPARSGKR